MPIFGRNTRKMQLMSENFMGKHAFWMASVQCKAKSLVFVAVIPKSTSKNHFSPAYHSLFFFHFFYMINEDFFPFWSFLSTGRYDVNFCIFHCKDCKNVFSPLDSSNLIQAGYCRKDFQDHLKVVFLRSLEVFSVNRGRVSSFYNAY